MNNEITNPVNLILIIIGLFLGLSLGIFLLFNNSAKNKANIYLGVLVLLSLTYFGPGFYFGSVYWSNILISLALQN